MTETSAPLSPHPDRDRVLAELHARPFLPISTPTRIVYAAFSAPPGQQQAD